MKKIPITVLLLICVMTYGQDRKTLVYKDFLKNVKECNVHYFAEKYNVDIANATLAASKVFVDPNLSLGTSDNQERKLKMGYSMEAGLDYTLELGNKRNSRVRLAESEAALTKALLEDYFRHLRADATLSFLSALKQQQLIDVQYLTFKHMKRLVQADSIRYRLGSIMEVDFMQSKLEVGVMQNNLLQSEAELKNKLIELAYLQGDKELEIMDSIAGNLNSVKRNFDLDLLITTALDNRTDLRVTLQSKEVSQRNLQLAKANRAIDLGLSVGVSRNAEVRNEIAPAPAFTSLSAGLSIPLKFSNTNKGALQAAKLALQQSEASYQAVELQIRSEVIQAYQTYRAADRQMEQFDEGLLSDAEKILQNKRYSYERGETGLLEVLNAQRTFNVVQESYYETIYHYNASLVELERSCGIWDLE